MIFIDKKHFTPTEIFSSKKYISDYTSLISAFRFSHNGALFVSNKMKFTIKVVNNCLIFSRNNKELVFANYSKEEVQFIKDFDKKEFWQILKFKEKCKDFGLKVKTVPNSKVGHGMIHKKATTKLYDKTYQLKLLKSFKNNELKKKFLANNPIPNI